LTSLTYFGRGF